MNRSPVHRNLLELFLPPFRTSPDTVAIIDGEVHFTYHQLRHGSASLAAHLIESDIRSGSTVALCLDRSPKLIISVLGIIEAGAADIVKLKLMKQGGFLRARRRSMADEAHGRSEPPRPLAASYGRCVARGSSTPTRVPSRRFHGRDRPRRHPLLPFRGGHCRREGGHHQPDGLHRRGWLRALRPRGGCGGPVARGPRGR